MLTLSELKIIEKEFNVNLFHNLYKVIFVLCVLAPVSLSANQKETARMTTSGSFDVNLTPETDDDLPAGRMQIKKAYSGGLVGAGLGQMLSKRTESGMSVYSAVEEFIGDVDGKTGSFTLFHVGKMSASGSELEIIVVSGSGTGALKNITGTMTITQDNGQHFYTFDYQM